MLQFLGGLNAMKLLIIINKNVFLILLLLI